MTDELFGNMIFIDMPKFLTRLYNFQNQSYFEVIR